VVKSDTLSGFFRALRVRALDANITPYQLSFMQMTTDIDQLSRVEKLAILTELYFELRLPLQDALRAAEADL
jgi:hypothetical protein